MVNLYVLPIWLQLTKALFVCSIARHLKTNGTWSEAMALEKENMQVLELVYGRNHPKVASTLHRCECMNVDLSYHIMICMDTYAGWASLRLNSGI